MTTYFFGFSGPTFKYSHSVGRAEHSGPGFRNPRALAISRDGVVYVVNRSFEEIPPAREGVRITMFTIDEGYVGQFGKGGGGDGQFTWPTSIALDNEDNVYVADEWLQRISVFDKKGEFLTKWGKAGHNGGELDRPSGLAFDREDHLHVVDSANHRVQMFTREGKFLATFGTYGSLEGQFDMPWGIAIDAKGDIWISDWRNDRIQKFTADGSWLGSFGSSGDLSGQFNRPSGVSVDKEGNIYVADWLNHRVQVFTPSFRYVTTILGDADFSKGGLEKLHANPGMVKMLAMVRDLTPLKRFWFPVAVEIDQEDRVLVLDSARDRFQVYQKELVPIT